MSMLERTTVMFMDRLGPHASYAGKEYALFHPSFGVETSRVPVMLVGQATNRWDPAFTCSLVDPADLASKARDWSNSLDDGELNPLDWVNKRWGAGMFRSFFWQVGYKVVNRYVGNPLSSDEWCKSVVWSNLAKVAPRLGGNPDAMEWTAQCSNAIELFRYEVETLAPELVLMLTNLEPWAKPFLDGWAMPEDVNTDDNGRIQWVGRFGNSRIIVTKRPHQRSGDYASAPYVDAIMAALKNTGSSEAASAT